jgi:hypothetical protein
MVSGWRIEKVTAAGDPSYVAGRSK